MTEDFSELENHLCFQSYTATRAIQRMYFPTLKKFDLTYPQYLVLVALDSYDHLSTHKLSELLELTTGTLTPLVNRMKLRGLVEKNRNQKDERIVSINLTEAGRQLRQDVKNLPLQLREKSKLNDNEWHTLIELTKKLNSNIGE